eukprot:TRINITY_DN31787_c0_g1_i1.p1 TRINITY_DN31787_c0_g1~~TRINITY_DN31787_c0_g1_i1.p1  ORF type:complete len:106 (-),score=8.75 TRINITY_DN31787_c0_g1_i1:105-422(-)
MEREANDWGRISQAYNIRVGGGGWGGERKQTTVNGCVCVWKRTHKRKRTPQAHENTTGKITNATEKGLQDNKNTWLYEENHLLSPEDGKTMPPSPVQPTAPCGVV